MDEKEIKAHNNRILEKAEKGEDKWFNYAREKAEEGNRMGQYELSGFYNDFGDFEKALYWAEKSAAQGFMDGQFLLGTFYLLGNDLVTVDYNKAYNFLSLAASQGHSTAQFHSGAMAYQFFNQPKLGIKWLTKSANGGNKEAGELLERIKQKEGNLGFWSKKLFS